MDLSKEYGTKIVKSMFNNYDFDFIITTSDDNLVYFEINNDNWKCSNNNISLSLRETPDKDIIMVYVYKRSEDYEFVGWYFINDNRFIGNNKFWETMFSEHLMI